jgi:hypothetical protein
MLFFSDMPTDAQKNSAVRVLPPIKRRKSAAFGPSDRAARGWSQAAFVFVTTCYPTPNPNAQKPAAMAMAMASCSELSAERLL